MDNMRGRNPSRARGTAAVEMAFVLPILLLLVMGAIEYGWLLHNVQQVTNAARQGARIASLPDGGASSRAQETMVKLLSEAKLPTTPPPTIEPCSIDVGGGVTVPGVRVQISVSTEGLLLINAPSLLPVPDTIKATVTMAKES